MKNVVYLNITDAYPFKFTANNSKDEVIARGLIENGDSVSVINNPLGSANIYELTSGTSKYGLEYIVFPKSKSSFISNVFRVYKFLKEKKQEKHNYLFLSYQYVPFFLLYVFLGWLTGYKMVVVITEWHRYFEKIHKIKRINTYLFDSFYGYFVHGSIPISDEIIEKIKHFDKPLLKVPILADYELIKPVSYDANREPYFLYCGHLGYFKVIELLLEAFETTLQTNPDVKLVLVVSGQEFRRKMLLSLLEDKKLFDNVLLKEQIPYDELIDLYCNALALLIPLRTKMQDTARFPHKIGEYIATGRPIITGAVGEVGRWFENGKTAYVAKEYSAEAYAEQMLAVSSDLEQATLIGQNARELGQNNFDYRAYGTKISDFLEEL